MTLSNEMRRKAYKATFDENTYKMILSQITNIAETGGTRFIILSASKTEVAQMPFLRGEGFDVDIYDRVFGRTGICVTWE